MEGPHPDAPEAVVPPTPASPAADEVDGWLLLRPHRVPERWKPRAIDYCLVPLLPSELDEVVDQRAPVAPELDPFDEQIIGLVARGLPTEDIARQLRTSARSVNRRLARLRRRFGVASKHELVRFLARRGF